MRPSQWARDNVERLAQHHRVVWVEDPFELIEPPDLEVLREGLAASGSLVVAVDNAFRLREQLWGHDPASARLVVIDRAFKVREPHLLPKDVRPADLRPLPAPDWKPVVDTQALFRPTVQAFLTDLTKGEGWPAEVNLYPYEKLARERTSDFVTAWESFREMGRALTTEELLVVGASAVLRLNLFSLADPLDALALAFHEKRWAALADYFNRQECESIRACLAALPTPLGDLFTDKRDSARMAIVALTVLQQHFQRDAGQHLRFLSPALAVYAECGLALSPGTEPGWFVETEMPAFEKLAATQPGFIEHLKGTLQLDEKENRERFAQKERLSKLLRDRLAPFDQQPARPSRSSGSHGFTLGELVPRFRIAKEELRTLVASGQRVVETLRLTSPRDLKLERILRPFVEGVHRADLVCGEVANLVGDIDGPARPSWQGIPDIEKTWLRERAEAVEAMQAARRMIESLDVAFGRCLEARYAEITPNEVPSTDHLYERYMGPRRRGTDGRHKPAVILVFDSLRYDLWRELVRPALEHDYVIEESVALARLPSETRVSRRAFFAGRAPGDLLPSGAETDQFAALLSRLHTTPISFTNADKRPGMAFAVRSTDGLTYATVFDFADVISHGVDWDVHTLRQVLEPLIRHVRAVLQEAGKDAIVFVTADHGHVFQGQGTPIPIEGPEGVGYRSAYVRERVQGQHAPHVFQIPARTLGHKKDGWYVFPKPGFALRDATRPFRPSGSYRHGGLSLFEVVIPVACLRHREARVSVRLTPSVSGRPVVGEPTTIEISVVADGVLSAPLTVTADNPGFAPIMARDLTPTPRTVSTAFVPTAPGRQSLRIAASLGSDEVAAATLELDVRAAAARESEDKAREKLKRLFGED